MPKCMSNRATETSTAKTNRYFNSYDINVNHELKLASDTNTDFFPLWRVRTEPELIKLVVKHNLILTVKLIVLLSLCKFTF